ncbi:UNVERIFIED_CONTAM: hypothetical protein Sangu_2845300 [Sesamum angustifolium]|uniref:Uncharacterized protein n=1 Tax=Sesamum angustifolium TaxID=2727405 RepID=A0AAW2IPM3_9LAMI
MPNKTSIAVRGGQQSPCILTELVTRGQRRRDRFSINHTRIMKDILQILVLGDLQAMIRTSQFQPKEILCLPKIFNGEKFMKQNKYQ